MKDKKKLIVLIVMLLMPVAGIWYFIKMSLKYMKGAEIEIFFPNNFFKQFGVWSIIWIILWIVIMFIERKYKVKKIKERKNSIKILQCYVCNGSDFVLDLCICFDWKVKSLYDVSFFSRNYRCFYGDIGDQNI